MDRNLIVKFFDFLMFIIFLEGKLRIEVDLVIGLLGYFDLLYVYIKVVIEYIDVYSFGVLLMVFFIGKLVFVFISFDGDFISY